MQSESTSEHVKITRKYATWPVASFSLQDTTFVVHKSAYGLHMQRLHDAISASYFYCGVSSSKWAGEIHISRRKAEDSGSLIRSIRLGPAGIPLIQAAPGGSRPIAGGSSQNPVDSVRPSTKSIEPVKRRFIQTELVLFSQNPLESPSDRRSMPSAEHRPAQIHPPSPARQTGFAGRTRRKLDEEEGRRRSLFGQRFD